MFAPFNFELNTLISTEMASMCRVSDLSNHQKARIQQTEEKKVLL